MMTPSEYPNYLYNALYTDSDGEVIGLDEVQLLDPIPNERIPVLSAQLGSDDLYLAYQCGLVLAAWGVEAGVMYLHHLIDIRIDKVIDFEPHRIWGQDNVYDVIADALGIAVLSEYDKNKIVEIIKQILQLYGQCYFESKLKQVLLNLDESALLPSIKEAMQDALNYKRYYQASQLLPVLAKYDRTYALKQAANFEYLIKQDKRIKYNIEEIELYN